MKIQHFKFNEKGLNRFFGPLEAKIMNILWSSSELSIKDVQQRLEKEKKMSFNTVMTVMNRLVEKDVLTKRSEGKGSLYCPVLTKEEFLEAQSKELTNGLIDEFGQIVVSHMIDSIEEADENLIAKLEQKIKEMKKEK